MSTMDENLKTHKMTNDIQNVVLQDLLKCSEKKISASCIAP